jgi:hypothetical protein
MTNTAVMSISIPDAPGAFTLPTFDCIPPVAVGLSTQLVASGVIIGGTVAPTLAVDAAASELFNARLADASAAELRACCTLVKASSSSMLIEKLSQSSSTSLLARLMEAKSVVVRPWP